MDELVKSVDALSRDQLFLLVQSLGLQSVMLPVLVPGATRGALPLAPHVTPEDRKVVENMTKVRAERGNCYVCICVCISGPRSWRLLQHP